ncbi:hypothetical protein NDU88_007562, partial [Pleurodeles waltl]
IMGCVYVVEKGRCLLGWSEQRALGIVLNPNSEDQVLAVLHDDPKVEKWRSKFPLLFGDKLGCLKKFQHRIVLRDGAVPRVHKVRATPLALKDALKDELAR